MDYGTDVEIQPRNCRKLQPRVINYEFRNALKKKVASQIFIDIDDSLQRFCDINIEILKKTCT